MSDVSVLSSQYQTLIDTSDKVNNSIITFKKKYLLSENQQNDRYKTLQLNQQESKDASGYLLHFLTDLLRLLGDSSDKSSDIPTIIAGEYVLKLKDNIPSIKEDLSELLKDIGEQSTLTQEQLRLLDMLIVTLDSERKVLFRKLRSSR